MKKALSYTVIFLGIQMFASGVVTLASRYIGDGTWLSPSYAVIVTLVLFAVISALVFIRFRWATPTRDYLLSRPWLVVTWSVLAAIGSVPVSMFCQEHMPELPNFVEEDMMNVVFTPGGYFVMCILAPLIEELVFRGAVLRSLLSSTTLKKSLSPNAHHWTMIVISALLFSVSHLNPAQMIHAFAIGLLLGWMYYRTNSIVPGVVFHCVNNTTAFLFIRFYSNSDIRLIDIFGSEQHVYYALFFSLLILLPSLYQLHHLMKKEG